MGNSLLLSRIATVKSYMSVMSQFRQSNATAAAPTAGTSPEADTLVEAYAEDLMDEIFDDVDRILAGDESAIYAEATPEPSSLFTAEAVTVPAMIVPFTGTPTVEAQSVAPMTETGADTASTDGKTVPPEQRSKKKPWRNFFLGALCLSAMGGVGVWWMQHQSALAPTATAPAATPTAPPVSPEVAFGDYLKRSLQVIGGERTAQVETQGSDVVAIAPGNAANTQTNPQPGGVIERVFVPMLQPSTGAASRTVPNTTSDNTPSNSRASLPAPNITGGQSSSNEPVPNIATANTYELVGVLELGDRSAALFEIDGASQRVYIGETIGGSGWSIVSITNEEVVVRRNGEVRSIYIGQRF